MECFDGVVLDGLVSSGEDDADASVSTEDEEYVAGSCAFKKDICCGVILGRFLDIASIEYSETKISISIFRCQ